MRMKHKLLALSAAAALVIGLTACSSSQDTPNGGDTEGNGEKIERITTAALFDSVYGHYDPFRSSGQATADGIILTMLYGQLVQLNQEGEIEADLAESFTPNDDATVWTLKLRDALVFSDGTPLDSEAVKWNIDRNANPENGTYHVVGVMGVTTSVVDETTLEIALTEPNANFDKLIASGIGMMVSPTAYEADPENFGQTPVGAGPYVLDSWTKGNEVIFKASPTYYAADDVTVGEVVIKVIRDASQQLNMLAAGEIDIMSGASGIIRGQAKDQGFVITDIIASGQGSGVLLNVRSAPFDDIRAREAVAYALDLDAIVEVTNGPGTKAAKAYFAETSPFYNGEVRPATNNPEKAQALFDELAAEGKPLSFSLISIDTGSSSMNEAIQSQLLAFNNVSVDIELQDVQTYAATLNKTHDFQMIQFGTLFIDPEPRYFDTFITGGNQNKMGYSNPKADELLQQARVTADTVERKKAYDEVQQIIADDVVQLKMEDPGAYFTHSPDLNLVLGNDGVVLYHQATR